MNLDHGLELIRVIPDFPKPGVRFQDITPLLANGEAFSALTEALGKQEPTAKLVAGIEARGFILAAAVAAEKKIGFIPIRKAGKLPASTFSQSYGLEYGTDSIELHRDAIAPGDHVLLIDDVLATGGTAVAAIDLIKMAGGKISHLAFLLEISELHGRELLSDKHPEIEVSSLLVV